MTLPQIALKIEDIREKIRKYDALYYGQGISEISDTEYDQLYHELENLEREHPEYDSPDSPTKRVGSDLTKEFPKVIHRIPMMSIENTYAEEEVGKWVERLQRALPSAALSFVGELKVDGVALALIYEDGRLVRGITRGDGVVGDDVTANVRTIRSIPLTVKYKGPFEVRGEVFMTFAAFTKLNERLCEDGEKPMQNPRNTTAGTLKLQDSAEVAMRSLSFVAHYLISDAHADSHAANLSFLTAIGLPTVTHSRPLSTVDAVYAFCDDWKSKRSGLPFPVDGVVIKVDDLAHHKELGTTAKSPRWVIAFKYQPERAVTNVEKIDAQVGRTGVITPIARLTPVLLAGTTIRNATLHNYDEINRLGLREGDSVEIEKGGEVIPKVIQVLIEQRPASISPFTPPASCPSCNSLLGKLTGEVALRCFNSSCPAQQFALLNHFVSRGAMDIRNLGPALLQQLLEKRLIASVADIYLLKIDQLAGLDRMGEKSAARVIASIETSKRAPLDRLINGLGIRMIGAQAAKVLAGQVADIADLFTMSCDQFSEIDTIGPTMAQSLRMYFDRGENRHLIERLRSCGVNLAGTPRSTANGPLSGKTFVLTGTLERFSREEAQREIEKRGGKVTSTVSSRTNYVVAGTDPGSKLAKAEKLNVPIIDEQRFIALFADG